MYQETLDLSLTFYNIVFGNMVFRQLHNQNPEIVKWDANFEHCYVLAIFDQDKEGYNLRFIGSSPFSEDHEDFMRLAQLAQTILDSLYRMDRYG